MCLLVFYLLFINTLSKAQVITNPSNNSGYDSTKATIHSNTTPGVSLVSDSIDYQPGSTAIFTGTGFLPNEQVKIKVTL